MQITQANMAALAEREVRPGLEQAFLEHKDRVFRAAYRITGNAGDAEDVLQTVFLRLVRQENLSEVSNLAAYLHRSAVNASLDMLRRRRDARTSSLDDDANQRTFGPRLSHEVLYSRLCRSKVGLAALGV